MPETGAEPQPRRAAAAVRHGEAARSSCATALALALAVLARPRAPTRSRPGFLELRETGPETYSLLWKKPTGGEVEISIAPVVPEGCRLFDPRPAAAHARARSIVRGTLTCTGGLAGRTIAIAGLETTVTDVLVRLHHADGRLESHLLRPATRRP